MLSRFWSFRLIAVAVCLGGAAMPSNVFAQSATLFGGSGALSGGSGFSAGTTGGSMGTAFPSSAMGSNSMPSNAMPSNAMPSNTLPGMSQTGAAGANGQRTGLVGQANTRFTGLTPAGGTAPTTGQNLQGQNRNTGRGGQGRNQNQNQNQNQGAGNQQQQQRVVRPQLVVAFNTPLPSAGTMSSRLSKRLDRLKDSGYEGVAIEVDGRKAILRGEVDSAEAKRMAAMLVKLEPGVRSVQNELTVKAQPAPAE
jgi:osmotically-inducible protein OsmY